LAIEEIAVAAAVLSKNFASNFESNAGRRPVTPVMG
jgi:hypothetical protein